MNNKQINSKGTKMELNKLTTGLISILITLTLAITTFAYQTGLYNNEIKNIKETQTIIKTELKEDINGMNEVKADKIVVEMMIKQMYDNLKRNAAEHKMIMEKLDKIIESNHGVK